MPKLNAYKAALRNVLREILIIFLYVFLVISVIGNVNQKFRGDGRGYYDYLPSIFIHHDLVRKDLPFSANPEIYDRIGKTGVYVAYKDHMVNMYPCGTALLEFPFFFVTYQISKIKGEDADGYGLPFQRTIYYAALFYLFFSLVFLKKALKIYQVKPSIITFCQFLMVLATPVTIYANKEAGFSHIYSLFAITAFIYYMRSYFSSGKNKDFILATLFLGLIVILRQINIMVVLFVPFLAGSYSMLVKGIKHLFRNYRILLLGILCFLTVFSLQAVLWHLQTGHFLLYSYQGYGFNFHEPQFFNILFSYRKGLFVYTPVLFVSFLCVSWFGIKKRYFQLFTWIGFFIFITYILSSWFSWYYGASYGLRAYIDYFTVFFIPLALVLNESNQIIRRSVVVLSILTIPLNIVQTYQYRHYILHNYKMDKDKYWRVFLKCDRQFRGLLYKTPVNLKEYEQVDQRAAGDYMVSPGKHGVICSVNSSDINDFQYVRLIQVSMDNDFHGKNDTRIALNIADTNESEQLHFERAYLIHFAEDELNRQQTGTYNFLINPIELPGEKQIQIECFPGKESTKLKNITVRFLGKK